MMDKQQPPLCVVSGDRLKEKRKTNYNFTCTDFLTNVKLRKKQTPLLGATGFAGKQEIFGTPETLGILKTLSN